MLMLLTLLPPAHVASLACNACGKECANACGTAMFRACCFNYNRKRSIPVEEFDNTAADIAANLSDGTEQNLKNIELSIDKINPFSKHFLSDKWLRLFGKTASEMRERDPQQYQPGNYYF